MIEIDRDHDAIDKSGRRLREWLIPAVAIVAATMVIVAPLVVAGWLSILAAGLIVVVVWLATLVLQAVWLRDLAEFERWLERALPPGPSLGPQVGSAISDRLVRPVRALLRQLQLSEERARANENIVQKLANAMPDPILFINTDLGIDWCNDAAQRAFDISDPKTPLGRCIRDPDFLAAITNVIAHGTALQAPIVRAHSPDIRYAARIEPLRFGEALSGVLVAAREESEALSIERMRSDFIANASHEMRTPLTAMTGIVETLRTSAKEDPEAREMFLAIMADETHRMTRLIDDLLSLSRMEASHQEPITGRCGLRQLVGEAIGILAPVARQSGIELLVNLPEKECEFPGDGDQLLQVIRNLLENAFKYGGSGKSVWIDASMRPQAPPEAGGLSGQPVVAIAVRDAGPGIERHHLSRLAERFYRVDKARSRATGGTGLGLAIVKHVLRRHGGHLDIASEIGQGSRFTVFLPAG